MIKNLEHISGTKKRLTVEIPADIIERKIQSSFNELRMRTKIPGFRPGKAPLSLLEKRFGQEVESDVLKKVVPEYYADAMKEANLSAVSNPEFEKREYERKSPFEMIFTVEVRPEIENLRYEGLTIKDENVDVSDEELETGLKRLQAERVSYEAVERPIEDNDLVTIDYDVVEENKHHSGEVIKMGSDQFPPEFSEELRGKSKGDTFEVSVTFPEDDRSEFRGKTLTFKGEVKEIKILALPDINDKFAEDLGYQGLAAMKDAVKADILSSKRKYTKKKQIVELLENLVETHDFPIPENMMKTELSALLTSARSKDENKDKDEETLKAELTPEAEKNVKAAVLLDIIGEKENISVSEEEMKEKVLEISRMTHIPPENLVRMYISKDGSLEGLRYGIYKEKVAEVIHSKARMEKGE